MGATEAGKKKTIQPVRCARGTRLPAHADDANFRRRLCSCCVGAVHLCVLATHAGRDRSCVARTEQGTRGPGEAERTAAASELVDVTVQPRRSSSGAGAGTGSRRWTSGRMQRRGETTTAVRDAAA